MLAPSRPLFTLGRLRLANTLHDMRADGMPLLFVADPSVTQRGQILGLIHEGKVNGGRRDLRALRIGPISRVYYWATATLVM